MPVKIVSDKPIKPRRVTCSKCTYELEYTGEDVKVDSGCYMGETDVWSYIVCPRCKTHVTVKAW